MFTRGWLPFFQYFTGGVFNFGNEYGVVAEIRVGSWEIPEPFRLLQDKGDIELEEMFRVFNMGIGMVAIVAPQAAVDISRRLATAGQRALPIGRVVSGPAGVVYDLGLTGFEP